MDNVFGPLSAKKRRFVPCVFRFGLVHIYNDMECFCWV